MQKRRATLPGIAPQANAPDDTVLTIDLVTMDDEPVVPTVPAPDDPKILVDGVPAEPIPARKLRADPEQRKRRARTIFINTSPRSASRGWRSFGAVVFFGAFMGLGGWYLGHRLAHPRAARPAVAKTAEQVIVATASPPPQTLAATTLPSASPMPSAIASPATPMTRAPHARLPVRQAAPVQRSLPRQPSGDPLTL